MNMRRASKSTALLKHDHCDPNVQPYVTMNSTLMDSLRSSLRCVLAENIHYFEEKSLGSLQGVKHFIDEEDWEALIKHNTKLFINYILGQYLCGNTQFAKMAWLKTCPKILSKDLWALSFSEHETTQKELCLFQGDNIMQIAYSGFAHMLRRLSIQPQHKEGMAEVILFYPGKLSLNKPIETNIHFQEVIYQFCSKFHVSLQAEDILDMFSTLEAMAELLDHSFMVSEGLLRCSRLCNPNDHQVTMRYTFEEGMWLGKLQETVMSKTFSMENHSDIVSELVNYAFYGISLKPDFYKRTGRLFWERIWNIYLNYPEFLALSAADKTMLLLNSFKTVYAVQCVILNGLPMEKIGHIIFTDKDRRGNVFLQYRCKQN